MDLAGTFASLASAAAALEARGHHHQVRLGVPIIFMYNKPNKPVLERPYNVKDLMRLDARKYLLT